MKYEVEIHKSNREIQHVEASSPQEALDLVSAGKGSPVVGGDVHKSMSAREYKPTECITRIASIG
jgi:hypothetical protein